MRILRKREAAARVGVSIMTLWRWEKAGLFPRRLQLGEGSVGYLDEEVESWLKAKLEQRDAA